MKYAITVLRERILQCDYEINLEKREPELCRRKFGYGLCKVNKKRIASLEKAIMELEKIK